MQDRSLLLKEDQVLARIQRGTQSTIDHIHMARLTINETHALMKKVDELLNRAQSSAAIRGPSKVTGLVSSMSALGHKRTFAVQ